MNLIEKLRIKKDSLKGNNKFWVGNFIITQSLVGKEILIYNGKIFKSFKVTELMIGYKLGCFIFTRRVGQDIHKDKKFRRK